MASDDDLEKRLRKLEARDLVPRQVGIAVHKVLTSGELPPDGTILSKTVRKTLATLEAIERVQEGVPVDEWTEEDERNSWGRRSSDTVQ